MPTSRLAILLEPWANGGKIFGLINGKPCQPHTKNVAVERHFYRLHRLTAADLTLLKLFIDIGQSHARGLHEDFVTALLAPRAFVEQHKNTSKIPAEMEEILLTQENQRAGGLSCQHRELVAPTLRAIRKGDLSFYEDTQECISFARYMATQYMRTKGIKVGMIDIFQRKNGLDISRVWTLRA
jgi:hypothetical protein